MIESMLGIDHAPRHRGGAGTVLFDKLHRMRAGLGIDDIVDVTLAPDGDVLREVSGHRDIAHAGEELGEFCWLRVRELDEFETVGAGGIRLADLGGRGVVWEGAHGSAPELLRPRLANFAHDSADTSHDACIQPLEMLLMCADRARLKENPWKMRASISLTARYWRSYKAMRGSPTTIFRNG